MKTSQGQVELIRLAKESFPGLLVSTSGQGGGTLPDDVARASDCLLIHFNTTELEAYPERIKALKEYGKPIVCNEDEEYREDGASAARLCVEYGASWGYMAISLNQAFPFVFRGASDDLKVYSEFRNLLGLQPAEEYFPPPESEGGWRKLKDPEEIHRLAGMDPEQLASLRKWLQESDPMGRDFAAVVIRNGYIVLEIEKGLNSKTDLGKAGIGSCAKAVCATVLAIASERSKGGRYPKKMQFENPAFQFIPWAQPIEDPRKAKITVGQLLNHTSGLVGEWWQIPDRGVKNHGP